MEQAAAPLSMSLKVVTGLTLALGAGFLMGTVIQPALLVAGLIVAAVSLGCYLYAPVAYEVRGDRLIVRRRWGELEFGPVTGCSRLTGSLSCGLRLWGNGGLFAATGIFWNRQFGVFRAYVTSARPEDLVVVVTAARRIVISPADPEAFIRGCGRL